MQTYRFHGIDEFKRIAAKRGGECLSEKYINYATPLRFRCIRGHVFKQAPNKILQRGDWCRRCHHLDNHKPKLTIESVDQLARKRGGRCLSTTYKGANYPLKWRCANGHEWSATPNGLIYRGRWCGECACNTKLGLKFCHDLAEEHGGKLISKKYHNKSEPLEWMCKEGHRWTATLGNVKNGGRWCPTCSRRKAGINRRLDIEEVRQIAKRRGGEFLAHEYSGNQILYRWRCAHNHEWENSVGNIKGGQWCPVCQSGYSERCVRLCFESLFAAEFPKKKPDWLLSDSGRPLELDGFNEDLKIAFEHQGRQHAELARFFYLGNENALERRIYLDRRKKRLCKQKGVRLICVPQLDDVLLLHDLEDFVTRACAKAGIRVPKRQKKVELDYAKAFRPSKVDWIERLRASAAVKGGTCLSQNWIGWSQKYLFICERKHTWEATAGSILHQGSWCKRCASSAQRRDAL
jgi:hypothetical protein